MPQEICREARTKFQSPNNQNYNTTKTRTTKTTRKHPKWICVAFFSFCFNTILCLSEESCGKCSPSLRWHTCSKQVRKSNHWTGDWSPVAWHTHHGCARTHGKIQEKEGVPWYCGGLQFLSPEEQLSVSSSQMLVCQDRAGREHSPHPHSCPWDWLSHLASHRGSGCKKPKWVHILGANDKVAKSGALFCQRVENSLSKFMNMLKCINFELDTDLRRPGVNTMQTHKAVSLPPLVCVRLLASMLLAYWVSTQ